MKVCTRCKQEKHPEGFSRNKRSSDGFQSECKDCNRTRYLAGRDRQIQLKTEYGRKNPEKRAEWRRTWYNRVKADASQAEKRKARLAVRRAIKSGKLIRPNACQKCGKYTKVEAHHADYASPLQVQWVCRRCHGAEHRVVGVAA